MNVATIERTLDEIRDKVRAGERLSAADGEFLFRDDVDLHAVGELANEVRQRKNGDRAYYNLNSHLNPTNVCVYQCKLCAFSVKKGERGAYEMTPDEMLARGREAVEAGCTEMHIVGGIHPDRGFAWYRDILARLHEAYPTLHLKAWTAVEIAWFARLEKCSYEEVYRRLMDVGLGSLPGGGAEILHPEIRRKICAGKLDAETWLDIHRTAHRMGLRSNATMLYGHVEEAEHRVDHMIRLRDLQDETGGFQVFIPLAFHPDGTALAEIEKSTGLNDLRVLAVSRLMLDNFDHIKAYWISLGLGTAQAALGYGADDLDGTVRQEKIHHEAGSTAPEALGVEHLRRLIVEAGRTPIERDTLYREVIRDGATWSVRA